MSATTGQRLIGAVLTVMGLAMTIWQWYAVLSEGDHFYLLWLNFWGLFLIVFGLDQLLALREPGQKRTLVLALAIGCGMANYYGSLVVLRDKLTQQAERRRKADEPPLTPGGDRPPGNVPISQTPMD